MNLPPSETPLAAPGGLQPACVLSFNANDPCGAGGLAADITTIATIGGYPAPVATGILVRDSSAVLAHHALSAELVAEQAAAVLEDLPVRAIKLGFAANTDNLAAVAAIASDYDSLPLIVHMPDLPWCTSEEIDDYHDAMSELVLPLASVLVGNHSTLWRWLLPQHDSARSPSARDLAAAAQQHGTPYVLVTGMPQPDAVLDNQLASAETVIASHKVARLPGRFIGCGDTLSAALCALLASGCSLEQAVPEALAYLDASLGAALHLGMGHAIPDRMYWAEPGDDAPDDDTSSSASLDLTRDDTTH
ncbi:bifunctional hydroxymethylpyrimidine kinase/phosphomethylpyrimidine kinase [Comamonas faecalis]|uniref:Bifunctional hydroxymethylpyrimidine kinase/phosphomethylpyrimidine kinase n=1 Tax=Comamonas faecalis TaxID=1387849 RepID=A0ABP7QKV4_9BURK